MPARVIDAMSLAELEKLAAEIRHRLADPTVKSLARSILRRSLVQVSMAIEGRKIKGGA